MNLSGVEWGQVPVILVHMIQFTITELLYSSLTSVESARVRGVPCVCVRVKSEVDAACRSARHAHGAVRWLSCRRVLSLVRRARVRLPKVQRARTSHLDVRLRHLRSPHRRSINTVYGVYYYTL